MKLWIAAAVLGAIPWAEAHGGTLKRAPQRVVYVRLEGRAATYAAKKIAGEVLQRAGVTLVWGTAGLRLELTENTPDGRAPGELAVSYPYDGCSKGITVFADRVRVLARGGSVEATPLGDLRESELLGYVLVHEITHVLEGMDRHSEAGIMKARWDGRDRAAIFQGRLRFSEQDLLLIERGLETGSGCAATLIAQSRPGTSRHPE